MSLFLSKFKHTIFQKKKGKIYSTCSKSRGLVETHLSNDIEKEIQPEVAQYGEEELLSVDALTVIILELPVEETLHTSDKPKPLELKSKKGMKISHLQKRILQIV